MVFMEWLKEYTKIKTDMDHYCERMIMSGSNIETVARFGEGMDKVVVGKILTMDRHPDADKLIVCKVDIGETDPVQIVCGAPNVFAGAFVPVILPDGVLPNGTVIRKGAIRGVESYGMLCSAKELGYEDKVIPVSHKDGIWILDGEHQPGADFVSALGLSGEVVDFEITPNRPDCLSMIGMARETAATFGGGIKYPDTVCTRESGTASDFINVTIKKPELCNRYTARIVEDVTIGPSPWWLQKRLMYAGMRPINNIVDVTNYVMLEYGQPIHAFDIRDIRGRQIEVDTATDGDTFITLDGNERRLSEGMLLIKDGEGAIAIAGVMGGRNSEIKDDTQTIVIESANFDCDNIRSTSKKLGLRTEASSRFEKGIDAGLTMTAADRVCFLIESIGAGKVVGGSVDFHPVISRRETIFVRIARINLLLGVELERDVIASMFDGLEFQWTWENEGFVVTPPPFRRDLKAEIDVIEEVARLYGYDRLPVTLPKGNCEARKTEKQVLRDLTKATLVGMGASEVQTYSFVSPKGLEQIGVAAEAKERLTVKLLNPLGEENSVMRTTLLPNLLEVLGRNFSRNIPSVKAFEMGNTFLNIPTEEGLPTEIESLCIASYGPGEDFFTLKGLLCQAFAKLGIQDPEFIPEQETKTYHPGRCARIVCQGREVGMIGEFHPDVLERYGIAARGCGCECDFDAMSELADTRRYYTPLPRYPSAARDIALLVDDAVQVADIETLIRKSGTEMLEEVALFDVYRGKQVPEGKKSVAFTLTYRAKDKTLTDQEVVDVHEGVLSSLREELNAVLREL